MTRSIHAALGDLRLERRYVIYPSRKRYALHSGVEAVPLVDLPGVEMLKSANRIFDRFLMEPSPKNLQAQRV